MSSEGFFQNLLAAIRQIQESEHDLSVIKSRLLNADGIDPDLVKPGGLVAKIRSDILALKSQSGAIG